MSLLSLSPFFLVGSPLLFDQLTFVVFFQVSATQASMSSTVWLTVAMVLERMSWDSSRQPSSTCRPEDPKTRILGGWPFARLHRCTSGVFSTKSPETVTQRPLRWKHGSRDYTCNTRLMQSSHAFIIRPQWRPLPMWMLQPSHTKLNCDFNVCWIHDKISWFVIVCVCVGHLKKFKHLGGLETGPIFHTKVQVRSAFQASLVMAMRLLLNLGAFLHSHCLQYVTKLISQRIHGANCLRYHWRMVLTDTSFCSSSRKGRLSFLEVWLSD